jgi:hypothetical protein
MATTTAPEAEEGQSDLRRVLASDQLLSERLGRSNAGCQPRIFYSKTEFFCRPHRMTIAAIMSIVAATNNGAR